MNLFWSFPDCYEPLLEGLLASGQKKSDQMASIFKTFEGFYQQIMEGPSEWHYLARRVLDYAFETIPEGSNWFAKYYALSEVVELKSKRIDEVYYNTHPLHRFYSSSEPWNWVD